MIKQGPRALKAKAGLLAALPILLLLDFGTGAAFGQQATKPEGSQTSDRSPGQEFGLRGQRAARVIKYSDWRKDCFKTPGTNMVCRTTITGTFETGQSAVGIDLIEREGDKAARLQLFLPVGLYLQAGVKVTIDQGAAYRIPYVWCLTNACVAGGPAEPRTITEMETGQRLSLEVVDANLLTVTTSLQLNRIAAVRNGAPTRTYEQNIDE